MNLKFAVSTWLWTSPFSTRSIPILEKARNIGFEGIEIAVEDTAIIDTREVGTALNDQGLEPVICGAFGPGRDLTSEKTGIRNSTVDYIRRCLDMCNELGARIFAGPMYSAVGKARQLPESQRREEFFRAAEQLRLVAELAQERDLQLAIEPLNRFETDLINTSHDVRKLVDSIDNPAARILLDSFHMTIEEKSLYDAVIEAGDKLVHLQVSENHRGIPGTGQTQWKKLRRGLEAINYSGMVSIESFTPDNKELAGAVCIWKKFVENQDEFATSGLEFLRDWAGENY